MAKKKTNDHGTGIPLHKVEALARILLPQIQAFFESEEGQKEFAEWKDKHKTNSITKKRTESIDSPAKYSEISDTQAVRDLLP